MENPIPVDRTPYRLFFLLFGPVALLILVGAWHVGQDRIDDEMELIRASEIGSVVMGVRRLDDELRLPLHQLRTLVQLDAVRQAIESDDAGGKRGMADAFSGLIAYTWVYDKIRWIDETGRERVRVNNEAGRPQRVAEDRLQDLAGRYYFKNTMQLKPGQIFVSQLDLNVENGKVDIPYKPMLRLATPVEDSAGRPRGILVLNVAARDLLNVFTESLVEARDHAMLLNDEGYWLKSPNSDDDWGFMFDRNETLGSRSPEAWKAIADIPSGQIEAADGLWTWSTVYPLKVEAHREVADPPHWLVVSHLPSNRLALVSRGAWTTVGVIGLILLSLFGIFAAWLTRALAGRTRAEVETAKAHAEAEAANRQREVLERFHLVVQANANGLLAIDAQGRIVLANPALERMFGYASQELLGLPMEILLPETARTRHVGQRQSFTRSPVARPMGTGRDLYGRRKDGSIFPVEISLSPFTEHGEQYVDAVVVDIAERKRTETLLRKSEAHLQMLVHSNPNGLVVVDEEGRIDLANPALERLFGYEPGELLGQPVECLVPEAAQEGHRRLRREYLQDPVVRPMGAGRRLHGLRKDGSSFPIEVSLASFTEEGLVFVQATVVGVAG